MSAPPSKPGNGRAAGVVAFAEAWAAVLHGSCYAPVSLGEVQEYLCDLTERLELVLRAERFDTGPAYRVGVDLVTADFADADVVGRTVEVLDERLLTDLGLTGEDVRQRLRRLIGAVATGYTNALRDRTLDDQESIRRAALVARERAERALRASEERVRHALTYDRLTGLPNRALLTHRLGVLLAGAAEAGRLGLCFIGLDGFKAINDALGHRAGDQVLIAVAERLRRGAGAGRLLSRVGGDEFAILVDRTAGVLDMVRVAEQVLAGLRAPVDVGGYQLPVAASIGIVELPAAGTDAIELMRSADMTLHWARADGGNRWVQFDPERNTRDVARYRLAASMPEALERREFTLVYQPLIDLATGSPVGAEALVRWRHPVHGLLAPARFIDLAEDTGLIVPLGLHLLEQACGQAEGWQGASSPYVSVNLAVRQTHDRELVDRVLDVLERTGLPAEKLQLEITESAALRTDGQTVHTIRALADLGIRIAVDDFGTGYSNLAYLRDLPLSTLKIDSAFVCGLGASGGSDDRDEAILATLVRLGHTLGLSVTVEGVETVAQVERLRAIGCDTAQGWYFGRPVPAGEIAERFAPRQPVGTESR
jgi:diguanylate cyclase (GGDEF)-like protein